MGNYHTYGYQIILNYDIQNMGTDHTYGYQIILN
jgi:hypothetical protein